MSLYTVTAEVFSDALASRGTITRILDFNSFSEINKIGSVSFLLALDDTQSVDLINENDFIVITVVTPLSTSTTIIIGRMIADEPKTIVKPDGTAFYEVSGPCFLYELTRRNMAFQIVSNGSGGKDASAPATILGNSDITWGTGSFSPAAGGAYIVSSGESVYDAFVNNEKQAGNFLSLSMSTGGTAEPFFNITRWGFGHAFEEQLLGTTTQFSKLKLVDNPSAADEMPIRDFQIIKETSQLVTRLHVYGAGQGEDRLTLENATTSPPAGFTVDTTNSIITNTTLEAVTNQPIVERVQHFSSIKSEDPSDATANTTAANELQQAAISWLREHDGSVTTFYRVQTIVTGAHQVGQLVTLTHSRTSPWDAAGAENDTSVININSTFYLLEYGLSFDSDNNLVADCLLGDVPNPIPDGNKIMAKRVKDLETVVRHANSGQSIGQPALPQGQDASYVLVAGSTALPNDRAATAGDGIDLTDGGAGSTLTWAVDVTDILGDGIVEATNNITLGTPSANTVATTSAVTASSHTHAITSSSDVTAASILASDADGRLGLEGLGIGTAQDGDYIKVATTTAIGLDNSSKGRFVFTDAATDTIQVLDADLNLGTGDLLQLRGASNGVESTASDIYGVNQLGIAAESNALIFIDANANSTTDYFAILKDAEVRTSATEILRVNESGALIIGDTDHSGLTQGIKINQGANDDDLIQVASTDVAHGMTTLVDTQVYGKHKKRSATDGGYQIHGLTEGVEGLAFLASSTTAVTTDTSSSLGAMTFRSYVKSGTDHVNMGATDNTHVFRNGSVTTMLLKGNGVLHLTDATPVALDDYDDVALLRTFDRETAVRGVIDSQWDKFVQYNRTHLENAGVLVGDFVSVQGMQRLMSGAVWQLHERIAELEAQLGNA